ERGFRLRYEARALLLDRAPVAFVREELREREERVPLGLEVGDDALLHVVERGLRLREATAARAVREQPLVQGVRRPHAAFLERARDVIDAGGEVRLRPVH